MRRFGVNGSASGALQHEDGDLALGARLVLVVPREDGYRALPPQRALLALGELANNDDDDTDALAEELGIDLADLQTEGGDEEAVPEQ